MNKANTTESFFESMYQANPDPWSFATSDYETSRYDATMEALGDRVFARAFEPGCSVGVLTKKLTHRCAQVEAIDISETAVQKARLRCAGTTAVIHQGALPAAIPSSTFDLIVFSEIGYYFEEQALKSILDRLVGQLEPGGMFLGVHWTGQSADHIMSGDSVHGIIRSQMGLILRESERHEGFLLESWVRA